MNVRRTACRVAGPLALALALAGPQGCSRGLTGGGGVVAAIGNYFADRAKDMLDLGDVGLSFSSQPCFAIYGNGVSLGGAGFGLVEGHFAGIGGGNVGWMPFYTADVGAMVWCYEELAFGEFDKSDLTTLNVQCTGVGGLVAGPWGRPGWEPS